MKKLTFFHWNVWPFVFFFQNISLSTTYQVFENWPIYLHQNCLNTLWSLIKMLWTSAKLGITRKNVKEFFFHWKGKIFFEIFCFQHSLSCCRNDLVTFTIVVWIFFGPMELLPDVAILSNTRESGSKSSGR